jgi:hypothetical protein
MGKAPASAFLQLRASGISGARPEGSNEQLAAYCQLISQFRDSHENTPIFMELRLLCVAEVRRSRSNSRPSFISASVTY